MLLHLIDVYVAFSIRRRSGETPGRSHVGHRIIGPSCVEMVPAPGRRLAELLTALLRMEHASVEARRPPLMGQRHSRELVEVGGPHQTYRRAMPRAMDIEGRQLARRLVVADRLGRGRRHLGKPRWDDAESSRPDEECWT